MSTWKTHFKFGLAFPKVVNNNLELYSVGDIPGEIKKNINNSDFGEVKTRRFFWRIHSFDKSTKDVIYIEELYRETYPTLQITICQVYRLSLYSSSHPSCRGRRDWLHEVMEESFKIFQRALFFQCMAKQIKKKVRAHSRALNSQANSWCHMHLKFYVCNVTPLQILVSATICATPHYFQFNYNKFNCLPIFMPQETLRDQLGALRQVAGDNEEIASHFSIFFLWKYTCAIHK